MGGGKGGAGGALGIGGLGGGKLIGTSLMPVRTTDMGKHAFGLLLSGFVSSHWLNDVMTSRGAVYPHEIT